MAALREEYRGERGTGLALAGRVETANAEIARLGRVIAGAQAHIDRLQGKVDGRAAPSAGQSIDASVRCDIDTAAPIKAAGGHLTLEGWITVVGAPLPLLVRLKVGDAIFDCQTGIARPDVAALFPGRPEAADCGFRVEAWMPPGLCLGLLEYRDARSPAWVPFRALSILAELGELKLNLEFEIPPAAVEGDWHIHGWCFHPQVEINSLEACFLGASAQLRYRLPRPDVAALFPALRTAAASGFSGHLHTPAGEGDLTLRARLGDGSIIEQVVRPGCRFKKRNDGGLQGVLWRERATRITLPAAAAPVVSIVIPVFNQLEVTLRCLASLAAVPTPVPCEIILVDDCSEPPVGETLRRVRGLRYFRNEQNQGFIRSCNRGAGESRGEYLLLLNNDTEVTAGWLEALIEVMRSRPDAGAVGARLVYPDGSLQEAGSVVWSDGSAWNYGHGDDPGRPEYNYVRRVDYCSGACLLVRRTLFRDLGGFDVAYCPAYYEDVALAFAIREKGYHVYYQPAATVIHYEGASSGRDLRTGVKQYQELNRLKFAQRWRDALRLYWGDPNSIEVACDRHAPGRLLVIDACALTPDRDAGSLRMFNLLLILARRGFKVTFAAANLQAYEPYSTQLRQAGVEHVNWPQVHSLENYLEHRAYAYDFVILSRKFVANKFLALLRRLAPGAALVFDTVDLMFLRLRRQAELERSAEIARQADESLRDEVALACAADLTYVVSREEATVLAQHVAPEKIATVPLIYDLEPTSRSWADRQGVLFVGNFRHPPNLDGLQFLLDEIWPRLSATAPGMVLHVVGDNLPDSFHPRATDTIKIHGYLSDLRPLFETVRLSIAPLRYGAGVKGKVMQSICHGVPVVATSIAIEGMDLENSVEVLVADGPAAFARAIADLYGDERLWTKLVRGGSAKIERYSSFAAAERQLMDSLRRLRPDFGELRASSRPASRPVASYLPGTQLKFGVGGNVGPYLGSGWSDPYDTFRWAVGRRARLAFRCPGNAPRLVRALLYPLLAPPRLRQQRVRIEVPGGAAPSEITLTAPEPTEMIWTLPASTNMNDPFAIEFQFPDATAPSELGASADTRLLSVAFLEIKFDLLNDAACLLSPAAKLS